MERTHPTTPQREPNLREDSIHSAPEPIMHEDVSSGREEIERERLQGEMDLPER